MEDGGAVRLLWPLLQYSNSYEEGHKNLLGSLQTGKHELLAAAASHTGLSYARTRSLLRQRETRKAKEPTESIIWKVLMWPIIKLKEIERFKSPVTLPVKAGLAALIAGLLCFAPGFLRPLNKNGVWAVITVDIVLETNVGLTFSKGICIFAINFFNPHMILLDCTEPLRRLQILNCTEIPVAHLLKP